MIEVLAAGGLGQADCAVGRPQNLRICMYRHDEDPQLKSEL